MKTITLLFLTIIFTGCTPNEEINITGSMKDIPDLNILQNNKKEITIFFNGNQVINGITDTGNNGHFIGDYKGTRVQADCSGSSTITCFIEHGDRKSSMTFRTQK